MRQQDDDPFTSPDPPAVGGSSGQNNQNQDQEVGFIPEGGSLLDMIDDEVRCENCRHYRTCALIAGFRSMTQQWEAGEPDEDAPVDAENFAVICEEFDPVDDI